MAELVQSFRNRLERRSWSVFPTPFLNCCHYFIPICTKIGINIPQFVGQYCLRPRPQAQQLLVLIVYFLYFFFFF